MTASPERLLITGAAGRIGSMLRPRLARPRRVLRLLDIAPISDPAPTEEVVTASVTDLDPLVIASSEVDTVIHLGGIASEAPWAQIAEVNMGGTYAVFEAARRAGVARVVFASSNHAVGFRPRGSEPVPADAPPAPDTYYGVSKVAGEALGSLYAHRYGLQVVCLRIGSCVERPTDLRALSTWLSPDDMARLVEASLTAESPGFRIVWGVSANTQGWFSLAEGHALGYRPRDDAEVFAPELISRSGEPDLSRVELRMVGGEFLHPGLQHTNSGH